MSDDIVPVGTVVRFKEPENDFEKNARYRVADLRGPRVLVHYIDPTHSLSFGCSQSFNVDELEMVDSILADVATVHGY